MSPMEFAIAGLILVVLVSWALFGRKPVKENPNCECGGCAVLKKEIQPEGVHGVYDPRPTQRGATERQAISVTRSRKAWLN